MTSADPSPPKEPAGGHRPATLVTGGAGFIGSHLVRQLLERGHRVRVIDLEDSPGLDARAEFVQGSALDRGLLRAALGGIGWVFHLAANPNLWAANKESDFTVNHEAARLVLEEAAACGAERIVHTSSEAVLLSHKRAAATPVDENVSLRLADMCGPYCRSKLLAEQEAFSAAQRGAPVVIVNPTMPIGPGDYRMTPPTCLLLDLLNGKHPAYLDFAMNLIDVRDAALGHILAAEKGRIGERYILGGENLRFSELLAMLGELTGLPMPRLKIPYGAALAFAAVSEFLADHVTRRPPKATLTGVRLAGAGMRIDRSKAARDLGLVQTPIRKALGETIAWLAAEGKLDRSLPRDTVSARDA